MEQWRDILDYEGLYQVSNLGNVKSLGNNKKRKEKILKCYENKLGYKQVNLCKNGIYYFLKAHRLVAQAFLGLDINDSKICVCHKDDSPSNNCVDNLFLGTTQDNMIDRTVKGRGNKGKYHLYISKKILQFDMNNNFIKEYNSTREAERETLVKSGGISHCCMGKYKHAGGFIWKYKIL